MVEWNVRVGEQDITNMIFGIDFGQGESQSVESRIEFGDTKEIRRKEWKSKAVDVEYEAV